MDIAHPSILQTLTTTTPIHRISDRHARSHNMSPIATQRIHSIATIGADGIGPEVVSAGVQVLRQLAQLDGTFDLEFKDYDWSSDLYKKTGQYIPEGGLEELRKHDAILFGAVGAPGGSISCQFVLAGAY
jgi:isocitrate dehydrogenase|tara:strand:- start:24689 stop:25078 length:390 start_codon:yes stop_codon:yes gene_type:complete